MYVSSIFFWTANRGFSSETISSTLDIAVDDSNEFDEDDSTLQQMQEDDFGLYIGDDIDPETVESHTTVEIDEETGEPVRTQMVYVDETACIGCYNCANVRYISLCINFETYIF